MPHLFGFEKRHVKRALIDAFVKLNPLSLYRNSGLFVTELCALLITWDAIRPPFDLFDLIVSFCLWLTVLFANFSESMAESKNKDQKQYWNASAKRVCVIGAQGEKSLIPFEHLKKGDTLFVDIGERIPTDGTIVEGASHIDISWITGETTPQFKGAHTDHSSVVGGSKVLSAPIKIMVTTLPNESFLSQLLSLTQGIKRPNMATETSLNILIDAQTLIFLIMVISLSYLGHFYNVKIPLSYQIAFFIALIPTTLFGLMSTVRIAGINRLFQKKVIAQSAHALDIAGDIDTILFDKTGTITTGERTVYTFTPISQEKEEEFYKATLLTSRNDMTIEGKSIFKEIKRKFPNFLIEETGRWEEIPFSPETRLSGVKKGEIGYWKGAKNAIVKLVGNDPSPLLAEAIVKITLLGNTPLLVASHREILGVIGLRDQIKRGLKEKLSRFREMGISTIMLTGDDPIAAGMIAKQVGIDAVFGDATPQAKLDYLTLLTDNGNLVAMAGDGINDAPALSKANLALVMNNGTEEAKQSANMIDLDSDPTKLLTIIEMSKQLQMTRGALTIFSFMSDVSKYLILLPAILSAFFPLFATYNILHFTTPKSMILSTVIFNALLIFFLIPFAYRGVKLQMPLSKRHHILNLLLYGISGFLVPIFSIQVIDLIIKFLEIL